MAVHHVEMDPEKSEARIDGAMTRGRGVKELVMGGSPDGRSVALYG